MYMCFLICSPREDQPNALPHSTSEAFLAMMSLQFGGEGEGAGGRRKGEVEMALFGDSLIHLSQSVGPNTPSQQTVIVHVSIFV